MINTKRNSWLELPYIVASLLFLLLCVYSDQLGAQVNLQLTSSGPTGPRLTGVGLRVRFQYRCASTNQAANQARLEIGIPSTLEFIETVNSPHIANSGYDAGTQKAWFEFVDPLSAGTTGEVAVRVRFPNGVTPDGQTATLSGVFSADGATSVNSSYTITAEAHSRLTASKYVLGQPGIGNETVYGITICNGEHNEIEDGTLDLGVITVQDQLPATATFERFDYGTSGILSSNYDAGTHTANWTLGGLSSGECRWVRFIVSYDAATNNLGQTVTNNVSVTSTPVGKGPETVTDAISHQFHSTDASSGVNKGVDNPNVYPGGYSGYNIYVRNSGTEVLTDLTVTDVIPYETEVFRITVGEYSDAADPNSSFVTLQYQTNLNSTWQTYSASPMKSWDGREVELSDLGLAFGGSEYLTQVRFSYGDRSNVFESYRRIWLSYRVRNGTPPGTITNCVTTSSTTPGAILDSHCVDFDVTEPLTGPSVYINLERESGFTNPFSVGDEIEFSSYIHNQSISGSTMDNFMGIIYFPKGSEYVPGSFVSNRQDGLVGAPALEYVEDFDGAGNSILRIKWSGSLPIDGLFDFNFRAKANNKAVANMGGIPLRVFASSSDVIESCTVEELVDQHDLDGDLNSSENMCYAETPIVISDYIAISSNLTVKGSLDNGYSAFPAEGQTLPGGLADYKLTIVNQGNVNLRDFTFLDIFPQVGDVGIIDPQQRNSAWRPNLIGPVIAPTGVVVYYSTAPNPCRAADGFLTTDPVGCQNANWTIVPPADITSVNSIKVEFGNVLIEPNDTLTFEWPMRTPIDVLSQPGVVPGDVAYNSAGFVASVDGSSSVLLPSEPVKTGLQIMSMVPGVIGDRVWSDTDGDGIQDIGEPGVNNVRVELYEDNGDGIANTSTDTYIGFTSTTGDGSYLFPGLSSGNYFVYFVKPPTFSIGPKQQGADPELDSDGTVYTSNGISGAISDITTVTNTDFNFSMDLSLVPTGLGAIGDYVWNDANANGIQDEGVAAGINGVTVELLSNGNTVLATTQSGVDESGNPGYFFFDNLTQASYRVRLQIPTGATLSASGQGGDANADSDGNPSNSGRTGLIPVIANSFLDNIDFGLQLSPTEICDNGIDDDGDGDTDCEDIECPSGNPVVRISLD